MPSKDYFQISAQILAGLLCSRPLVSLYVHDPGLDEVRLAHRAGEFLPAGRRAELIEACGRGGLLLSRADHGAFVGHMSANLGPALFCSGLGQGEIAEILRRALKARIEAFFSRPLKPALDDLRRDLSTLVEYVQTEPGRMDALLRGLDREYGLANHSVNCLLIGLALCLAGGEKGLARPDL
ncbi:MAG: metal-dependent phosphohydrolase, partial [Desulfovibrionaceae bacterium]|nr:metal-dependent phosphohydrolase [Desulfovibrionaceae bacterium]